MKRFSVGCLAKMTSTYQNSQDNGGVEGRAIWQTSKRPKQKKVMILKIFSRKKWRFLLT
jgi:hypothetical protein